MARDWHVWVSFNWEPHSNVNWDAWWKEVKTWKGPWGAVMEAWSSSGEWDGWCKLETSDPEAAQAFVAKLLSDKYIKRSSTHWWYKAA